MIPSLQNISFGQLVYTNADGRDYLKKYQGAKEDGTIQFYMMDVDNVERATNGLKRTKTPDWSA